MKKQSIATLAALCVMLLLVISMAGCSGSDGSAGSAGISAPVAGTVSGVVTNATGTAVGILGVTVTTSPTVTGGSATTDATGAYSITVPGGVYTLTFAKTLYTSGTSNVTVINGKTMTVNSAMSEAAGGKPTVTVAASGNNVGYGVPVTVTANATSPLGLPVAYSWLRKQTATGGVASAITATAGQNVVVTNSETLVSAMSGSTATKTDKGSYVTPFDIARRLQVLPVNADTRGVVAVTVTANDGQGGKTDASVTVNSAAPNSAVKQVALGRITYLANANVKSTGTNTWTLTLPDGTNGTANLSLVTGTTLYSSFTPTVEGKYIVNVVSAATNSSIPVFAGTYQGAIAGGGVVTKTMTGDMANNSMWYDTASYGSAPTFTNWPTVTQAAACASCHDGATAQNIWADWGNTVHATFFARGINALQTNSGTCLTCHVTGYDGANSGDKGFDDMQTLVANSTWVYAKKANAWTSMTASYPQLAALASISCENCHGPNSAASGANTGHKTSGTVLTTYGSFSTAYRVSYNADVCGTCHSSGTGHHIFSEWGNLNPDSSYKGHGKKSVAPGHPNCACHAAQAFVTKLSDTVSGAYYGLGTYQPWETNDAEPITCQACHDPHSDANPNQLRTYDTYTTPNWSGFAVAGLGKGAICTKCHNQRIPTKCVNDGVVSKITNSFSCNVIGASTNGNNILGVVGNGEGRVLGVSGAKLNEDLENYTQGGINYAGFPEVYSNGHDASQADVLMGRNAYWMGNSLPMLSKHANVEDSCVGCHIALNPQTHLSHGAPAVSGHVMYITDADRPNLCANCHSATVDGEALAVAVEDGMADIKTAMAANFQQQLEGGTIVGQESKLYFVSSWAFATNSTSTFIRQVIVTTGTTTYASSGGTSISIYSAKTLTYNTVTGAYIGGGLTNNGGNGSSFAFGSLMTSTAGAPTTWTPFIVPSNVLNMAAVNFKLLDVDESKGVHNPSFVLGVINATLQNL